MATPHNPVTALLDQLIERAAGNIPGPEACLHQIPASNYTDPDVFDREWDTIFCRRPLVLCHETQLPAAGDALVHDHLGLPLVTVRDANGNIATFMNICRHRGMRLLQNTGFQQLRSMVCPYHQWTYGTDGRLRNIPREPDFLGIRKEELGLVQIPTEVRHGLVWLQLQGSIELDKHLAGLGEDLQHFDVDTAVFHKHNTRELQCNWKLVHDAFLDGYHVVRLHKNTVGAFFPDSLAMSEQVGEHIRSAVGRNEILDAAGLPADQRDPRVLSTFSYMLFPNSVVIMHPEYTSLISLFPLAADRTVFSHSMLVATPPTDEKSIEHFNKSFDLIDQGVFQAEDIFVCEGAQSGMASGANSSLLLGANEQPVWQFHQTVNAAVSC